VILGRFRRAPLLYFSRFVGVYQEIIMDMLRTVNAADAQHRFPQILADVCNGAEVIIARDNQPVAALVNTASLRHFQRTPERQPRAAPANINRAQAIENLKAVRRRVKFAATFEEVIAARDEGRR